MRFRDPEFGVRRPEEQVDWERELNAKPNSVFVVSLPVRLLRLILGVLYISKRRFPRFFAALRMILQHFCDI